ncbi:MAG: hypothetical protein WC222_09610 [Parachlamydiales bacterium]|jgi:hypothetical protein
MDIFQLVGFGIGIVSLIYMYRKKKRDERLKQEDPKAWERQQEERGSDLKKLLRTMDLDIFDDEEEMEEEHTPSQKILHTESPKAVPRMQQPTVKSVASLPPPKTALLIKRPTPYQTRALVRNPQRVREGMILREILSAPRSLNPYDFPNP